MARPKTTLPVSATDIDERDFFKALHAPRGAAAVGDALRRYNAGDRAGAYDALVKLHRARFARECNETLDQLRTRRPPKPDALKNLLNHRINVWHIQVIQFDRKIDWWPAGQVLDNLCGLHRLSWMHPATVAMARTGERKYRDFLIDIASQYDAADTHPKWSDIRLRGYSFLEITAKWNTLLPAYLALLQREDVKPEELAPFLRLFLRFGRSIVATLGVFQAGYNAQAVAFTTLLHLARLFPEFRESKSWDRAAVKMVVQHAREGFYEDGGNRERVWGYGTMHVSSLTKPYEIAMRYGGLGGHEREVHDTLLGACRWYIQTVAPPPTHAFPTYGDAGWGAHDTLPTIHAMANVLPEFRKDKTLGVDRSHGYCLRPSGFVVMRNGDDDRSSYVNSSFGEFAGWHSHWDLLSMNLWAFGTPLLEELCRFGPYANPLNQTFYAPESHNLVLIDGMIYDSRLVKGEDVQWFSDDRVEYFSAYHRAYRYFVYGREGSDISPNIEGKIRRTILLVKDPGYVVVMDAVEDINRPVFKSAISQYWHAPLPFRRASKNTLATGGGAGRPGCLLIQAHTDGLHRLDTSKDFGGEEIAHLGVGYDRYCLRARRWMPINHQGISGFLTVLYPFKGKAPRVTATPIAFDGVDPYRADAVEVISPAGRDLIVLNPERRAGVKWKGKPFKSAAAVELGDGRGRTVVSSTK